MDDDCDDDRNKNNLGPGNNSRNDNSDNGYNNDYNTVGLPDLLLCILIQS